MPAASGRAQPLAPTCAALQQARHRLPFTPAVAPDAGCRAAGCARDGADGGAAGAAVAAAGAALAAAAASWRMPCRRSERLYSAADSDSIADRPSNTFDKHVYDAFCSAPVSCGKCLPGTSTLTALETVSGPGYCLITSMPMLWSVAFCVEEGFLGAMRAMSLRFARRAVHTLFARTAGVNVSRVPQVPVWTCGGYLGIRCAEGIAFTHTPR